VREALLAVGALVGLLTWRREWTTDVRYVVSDLEEPWFHFDSFAFAVIMNRTMNDW